MVKRLLTIDSRDSNISITEKVTVNVLELISVLNAWIWSFHLAKGRTAKIQNNDGFQYFTIYFEQC